MEDEVRVILKNTLTKEEETPSNLAVSIRSRFGPLGGLELPETIREPVRKPLSLTR